MAKLTGTMRKLLISSSSNDLIIVGTGCYTGARKASSYGKRDHDAARKLIDAGLIVHVSSTSGRHYMARGGTTCHYSEHLFRLTDEGLKVRASLVA